MSLITKSFKDLCIEIEILETRINSYENQLKELEKQGKIYGPGEVTATDYSEPHVQSSGQIAFEKYLELSSRILNHIYLHETRLKQLIKEKEYIKDMVDKLEGLDKKVVCMNKIQGKSLKQIADELGYSYQYIKEISARNNITYQEPTDNDKQR